MDRAEAASLLGVPIDADAAQVRRAYRVWARLAHPDLGGDPAAFANLTQARRVMLRPRAAAGTTGTPPRPPRPPVSAMIRTPEHVTTLVVTAIAAIALTELPLLGVHPAIAAIIAGFAAATWSFMATRATLRSGADAGHRIVMLAWTWLPLAAIDVLLGTITGTGIISVLPLLALPFVAVVASVNAGAGLWRPSF